MDLWFYPAKRHRRPSTYAKASVDMAEHILARRVFPKGMPLAAVLLCVKSTILVIKLVFIVEQEINDKGQANSGIDICRPCSI